MVKGKKRNYTEHFKSMYQRKEESFSGASVTEMRFARWRCRRIRPPAGLWVGSVEGLGDEPENLYSILKSIEFLK